MITGQMKKCTRCAFYRYKLDSRGVCFTCQLAEVRAELITSEPDMTEVYINGVPVLVENLYDE